MDCNVWIEGIFGLNSFSSQIIELILANKLSVFISSYGVSEVINVIRRISRDYNQPTEKFEKNFWSILNHENIQKEFKSDITQSLLQEIRHRTEIKILAELLELEDKDIPYIITAYKHKCPIVTNDKRSLLDKKDLIQKQINVEIVSAQEFIKNFS